MQLANAAIEPSVTPTGIAGACRREQAKHTHSQAACEIAQQVQHLQQVAAQRSEGKLAVGPVSSPRCGSGLCISTPSLVDATGMQCKPAPVGTSDLADSRHSGMHLDLQQSAGSAPAALTSKQPEQLCTKASAPAAPLPSMVPAAAATAAAETAMCNSTLLPGSSLLQQLHYLTYSLSEAVRLQDRPRQQLVLLLLKSFPVTPQLLLASQIGHVVRRVLQLAKKQQCQQQQQADAVQAAVVAAARALHRQWRAVLQAAVGAADRSQVQRACQMLQGTAVAKAPQLQQLLITPAAGSQAAAAPVPTSKHQHRHLQQIPLACTTHMKHRQTPAHTSKVHTLTSHIQSEHPSSDTLLSPAQKLQLLLKGTAVVDAAMPAKESKRPIKRGREQQHVTFGAVDHQAVTDVQQRPNSLLQQLRAQQQQQQQQQNLPALQVPAGQVKRSRASKSSSHSKRKQQQAAAPPAKKHKLESAVQRDISTTVGMPPGLQQQQQQQQRVTSDAVPPRGVHASWLTAFVNRNTTGAGAELQSNRAVATAGAATGTAGSSYPVDQPSADLTQPLPPPPAAAAAAMNSSSIMHHNNAVTGTQAPNTQAVASLPVISLGRAASATTPGAPVGSAPVYSSPVSRGAAATAVSGASPDSPPPPPPPHVTVRPGRAGGVGGLGHTAETPAGSPAGGAVKGQQNKMWGAGAVALRAAKGPGYHASQQHAQHGQHAGGQAARGGGHGLHSTWRAAAAAAAGRRGSCAAGSMLASELHDGVAAGNMAAMKAAAGAAAAGVGCVGSGAAGALTGNGCWNRTAGVPADSKLAQASCKPFGAPRCDPNGFDLGGRGGLGGVGASGGLGSAGGAAGPAAAAGDVGCDESDDEGSVLVDTRLQSGGLLLASMDSMPLLGGGAGAEPQPVAAAAVRSASVALPAELGRQAVCGSC